MILVVDASVAIKVLTQEQDSDRAAELLARMEHRIAPDFIRWEVASALAKKVRLAGLPADQAREALAALPLLLPAMIETSSLLSAALELSIALNHALFDCFYLALAIAHDGVVVTADRKFLKSASAEHGRRVIGLEAAQTI